MPYKIVQTIENGEIKLTAVPEQWEHGGILHYPHKKSEKLRKNENSIPKESWVSMNCIVKRMNLTYNEAEIEVEKMCKTSDTETDLEDNSSRKRKKSNIVLEDNSNENYFNQLATECLNVNDVPYSVANEGNEIVYIAEDTGTVQFSIPEIPVNKFSLNTKADSSGVESKLEGLTQKVNVLSENIIIVQKNQAELYKTQQDILFSLVNINTQFEELIKKVHIQPEVKENEVGFKRISDQESFDNFEKMLENANLAKDLLKSMSAICGTHRGKGINNAYALIDVMFERKFLQQCSWAGGSRTDSSKICFKSRINILNFFFSVINKADENFTLIDTQKFFKVILRNSRQRCESQQERTSVTKSKKRKHKPAQGVQLLPEQNINPGQSTIVSQQKPSDVNALIQMSERGFATFNSTEAISKPSIQGISREVSIIANQISEKSPAKVAAIVQPGSSTVEPSREIVKQNASDVDPLIQMSERGFSKQSVHLPQNQPIEALPKSIRLPELSNIELSIQGFSREVSTIANQISENPQAKVGAIVQPGSSTVEPSREIVKQNASDVDPLIQMSERGFSKQSVHLSQNQPIEALPKSIRLPELSNIELSIQGFSREVSTIANQISENPQAKVGAIVQPGSSDAEPSRETVKQISQKEPVKTRVDAQPELSNLEPLIVGSQGQ